MEIYFLLEMELAALKHPFLASKYISILLFPVREPSLPATQIPATAGYSAGT
jgi:hypothetical protein